MRTFKILLFYLFILAGLSLYLSSCAASAEGSKPVTPPIAADFLMQDEEDVPSVFSLIGTEKGLYKVAKNKTFIPLWTNGKVTKIIRTTNAQKENETRWFFLTSKGILTSTDLESFELRNDGLPFLTIKEYNETETTYTKQIMQLKDLSVHPQNPEILVTSTKEKVYVSKNAGSTWTDVGSMSENTTGIKAVAIADINNELVVFMAHAIYGFSYKKIDANKPVWTDVTAGFEIQQTQGYPDEIADIMPVVFADSEGKPVTEVYVSQTFRPRLYRFNWKAQRAEKIYSGNEPCDTIDGLFWNGKEILYSAPGQIGTFNPTTNVHGEDPLYFKQWEDVICSSNARGTLHAAWIPDDNNGLALSEMWLLKADTTNNTYAATALNRKAVYAPAHQVNTKEGIIRYKKILKENKLDAIVVDMKDDAGLLRYDAKDPVVVEKGFVSKFHINLAEFTQEFKNDNIYLIARIVVFKDKNLADYDKKQYAIWDSKRDKPWVGIRGYENGSPEYYDENWVDPHSPEVWDYNVRIAKELIAGGFDEIQFDYIRFPTDGINMKNTKFRWKTEGMDKEDALLSFLSYARKNIKAPIGIDIYGANGWYRSGTRTGQDVEQLAEYVDVICPMFYPSHFEQTFLNYEPKSERPYSIYYYGTYRNTVIGRNKIIVRPWVQAFYIGVSYDRTYYNKNYVQKEVYGVRDSVNRGYMYWNNVGRYEDILPDVADTKYTGPAMEAKDIYRKPALSSGKKKQKEEQPAVPENEQNVMIQPEKQVSARPKQIKTTNTKKQTKKPQVEKTSSSHATVPSMNDIQKIWKAYSENGV